MKHNLKQQHIQLFLIYYTAHVCICNVFPIVFMIGLLKQYWLPIKQVFFLFDVEMLTNNKIIINIWQKFSIIKIWKSKFLEYLGK